MPSKNGIRERSRKKPWAPWMDQLRANRTTAGNDMNGIESPQEHMWNMTH